MLVAVSLERSRQGAKEGKGPLTITLKDRQSFFVCLTPSCRTQNKLPGGDISGPKREIQKTQ